jgi:predicted PhzF superfamily epimerase YddE/YHI9
MKVPIVQVDAFTNRPFAGNSAAVCVLDAAASAEWMRLVAREMNLSETAFVVPRGNGGGFDLRWFTPAVEVDLCGHATLASAHVLWETGRLDPSAAARFETRSGLLTAVRRGDWIELDFPATPADPTTAPPGLEQGLRLKPAYVGRSRFDYLVEVADEDAVRTLQPDFIRLRDIEARGIIVTSRSSADGSDFVSRYFAPAFGIDEDPVTGSTHCCLGPYWASILGKTTLVARQISNRGGVLKVTVDGDRVKIAGQAVTVLRGELDA